MEASRVTKVMSHIIEVRKKGDSQKGVREAADLQKRDPRSKKFGNLWVRFVVDNLNFLILVKIPSTVEEVKPLVCEIESRRSLWNVFFGRR